MARFERKTEENYWLIDKLLIYRVSRERVIYFRSSWYQCVISRLFQLYFVFLYIFFPSNVTVERGWTLVIHRTFKILTFKIKKLHRVKKISEHGSILYLLCSIVCYQYENCESEQRTTVFNSSVCSFICSDLCDGIQRVLSVNLVLFPIAF